MKEPGTVIMAHPLRAPMAEALQRSLAPLTVPVVYDPQPDGDPSPLRTAKEAWKKWDRERSHLLVLQDDAHPVPGFGERLAEWLRPQEHSAVAFYVNGSGVHGSYRLRRAAFAGYGRALLAPWEYTPCVALAVETALAEELAGHLASYEDSFAADDEAVAEFFRGRKIPVTALTVSPVGHAQVSSLVGNAGHGSRPAVASGHEAPVDALPDLLDGSRYLHTVNVLRGQCVVDLPTEGESFFDRAFRNFEEWHPWKTASDYFGLDAADLAAAGRDRTENARERIGDGPAAALVDEFWAAGCLLGADIRAEQGEAPLHLREILARTWVRCAAELAGIACDRADVETIAALTVEAVDFGRRSEAQR